MLLHSQVRNHSLFTSFLFVIFLLRAAPAGAEVIVQAAVNSASYLYALLPNGKLAQGVLFTVFGMGMSTEPLTHAGTFPLPAELTETSVRVNVAGMTRGCPMIYTSDRQIAAILPSDIPAGSGTLTVIHNGETSQPLPIEVVAHAFGIYTVNQAGYGAGAISNPLTNALNTMFAAANPGQLMDVWGTGLGAVNANEAAGPAPGDLASLDVRVYVAGKQAQVVSRGRSGCCAGIDQIRFIVPEGVTGCFVPVHVEVEGMSSNYATMSIAAAGSLRPASLRLSRARYDSPSFPYPRSDGASAYFYPIRKNEILSSTLNLILPVRRLPIGSCMAAQGYGIGFITSSGFGLDPGTLSLSGPPGSFTFPGFSFSGIYQLSFVPGFPNPPDGLIIDGTVLTPGTYTFSATGEPSGNLPSPRPTVGPFSASIVMPPLFEWTNKRSFTVIDRNLPLTITWTNQVPGAVVRITGSSVFARLSNSPLILGFECWADTAADSFTVPPEILASLPPSQELFTNSAGSLGISLWTFGSAFTAPGLDSGHISTADSISKPVSFR
ncbi:MAG: hypothetical protein HY316_10270 [Acidobacteria bacterium]|nr:hypothetical protein [Acidobacteriota bacterium]